MSYYLFFSDASAKRDAERERIRKIDEQSTHEERSLEHGQMVVKDSYPGYEVYVNDEGEEILATAWYPASVPLNKEQLNLVVAEVSELRKIQERDGTPVHEDQWEEWSSASHIPEIVYS